MEVCEPDVSPVQIQGPKSRDVVEALFGTGIAGLAYYTLAETMLGEIPVVVTRTGWSGEFGYEVFLRDSRFGDTLWDRILDAGRPHGIAVCGPSDIRRVEAGILGYGCDIGLDTNPFEAGMDRMVDLDSGRDFIGREALAVIRAAGVTRRIVGIELAGTPLAQGSFTERWPVMPQGGGDRIGDALIALHSPRLEKNIGYAMLAIAHTAPGTGVEVAAPGGERAATVVEMPFVEAVKT